MQQRSDVSPLVATDRWAGVLHRPPEKTPSMRVFGLVMLIGFGLLGGLLLWGWMREATAWRLYAGSLLVSVGVLVFLWSLIAPGSLPPVYAAWMAFGQRLGTFVSTILLGVAYWIVVTPVGLLMRLTGTDPLERRVTRGPGSHWHRHAGPRPPGDYEHMS